MSEEENFHPPIVNPDGTLKPNPNARYLKPAEILAFSDEIKGVLKEVGGTILLAQCQEIFRRLDNVVGDQLRADHALALAREPKAERIETEGEEGS